MNKTNPFVLPDEQYSRQLNTMQDYIAQSATYLQTMTGKDFEVCRNFIVQSIKNKRFSKSTMPSVEYLRRKDNGDREKVVEPLPKYLKEAVREEDIIVPTLTCYHNPKVMPSITVEFIDNNVKARSLAKKAEFAAEARGDRVAAKMNNIEQTNRKLSNNAFSGAMVSASTPLYNKTGHSSLTSICRITSGFGNANNEKLLTGNRHYWSSDVVMNNIASIISNTDYSTLNAVIQKYCINIPSAQQTIEVIKYSSDLYWRDCKAFEKIEAFVHKLNDLQRAAFVYTSDLYHLRVFNDHLVREFLGKLSKKASAYPQHADPIAIIHSYHEDYVNLAHLICMDITKGIGKDYKLLDSEKLHILTNTVINISEVVQQYADLIRIFFVTTNLPASLAYFPSSIRRSAMTSDTDSTIFSVEEWVRWYNRLSQDQLPAVNESTVALASSCVFIASQAITHILAVMSANIGVEKKRLHQVAMKNEFFFPVFVPTQLNKHYFAKILCQEGNVFSKMKNEIKGVHMKSSNVPKNITAKAEELMNLIMDKSMNGQPISIRAILRDVAAFETNIIDSLVKGETMYYKTLQIKTKDSYKNPESSPFNHHVFWQSVFSQTYHDAPNPTYSCIKIPTILNNKTQLQKWITSIDDVNIKNRLKQYLVINSKDSYPTILLSHENIFLHGIPKEISCIIDTRRIVLDLCSSIYITLQTIGYYKRDDLLVRDYEELYL